jgi:hypothetical protein
MIATALPWSRRDAPQESRARGQAQAMEPVNWQGAPGAV